MAYVRPATEEELAKSPFWVMHELSMLRQIARKHLCDCGDSSPLATDHEPLCTYRRSTCTV